MSGRRLAAVAAWAALFVLAAALTLKDIGSLDYWWHLRAGQLIAETGAVPSHDSFTYTVLATLEALGFCKPGEGGAFVSNQRTAPGGEFPLNTNGGGLSYTHPGMYGMFLLIEAARQLRGECGERQVAGAKLGLVNGTGGAMSSTGTLILGVD